jgi:hypothetical protein
MRKYSAAIAGLLVAGLAQGCVAPTESGWGQRPTPQVAGKGKSVQKASLEKRRTSSVSHRKPAVAVGASSSASPTGINPQILEEHGGGGGSGGGGW